MMNCQQLRGCTFALSGGCTKLLTKSPQSHLWRFKKHHSKHTFRYFQRTLVAWKSHWCVFDFFPLSHSNRRRHHYEVYHASFKKQFEKLFALLDLYFFCECPFSIAIIRKRLLTATDDVLTSGASSLFAFSIYMREWCFLIFLALLFFWNSLIEHFYVNFPLLFLI